MGGSLVSGNPIRYNNGTQFGFSWSEGRNLSTAATSSNSYTFRYDADGLRNQKNSANSGVSRVSNYLYAGGKLLRESRGVAYSHGPSSSLTLDFTYDASGSPYSLIYNNGRTTATYYYITNLQGDVMYLVDENGNEAASYTYDPYGKILTATGTMAGINPLRYRGYYYDTETGFYYLQSRYYDPAIGRFLNADSYASTGQGLFGFNMFAYCGNNPVTLADPSGHFALTAFLGAVVGGAIAGALISTVSYLAGSGLNGQEVTGSGILNAALTGAASGAIGGTIGTIALARDDFTLVAKGIASIALGAVMGIKAGIDAEGSLGERIGTGITTGVITASSTFAGSLVETNGGGFVGTAFASFSVTLTVGAPAEVASVGIQQAIRAGSRSSSRYTRDSKADAYHVGSSRLSTKPVAVRF